MAPSNWRGARPESVSRSSYLYGPLEEGEMPVFTKLRSAIQHLDRGVMDLHLATAKGVQKTITVSAQPIPDLILNLFVFLGLYKKALARRGETPSEVPMFRPVGVDRALYDQQHPVLIFRFQEGAEIPFLFPTSALPEIQA